MPKRGPGQISDTALSNVSASEVKMNGQRYLKKSYVTPGVKNSIAHPTRRRCTRKPRTSQSKAMREQKTPVNSEVQIPKIVVTAKPLIGPVPYWNSTIVAISVVICESKIDENARENPCSTATRGLLPLRSSSRMRSLISTFASTATPMLSAIATRPGSVIDASKNACAASRNNKCRITITSAITPP